MNIYDIINKEKETPSKVDPNGPAFDINPKEVKKPKYTRKTKTFALNSIENQKRPNILLVDDDVDTLSLLQFVVQNVGYFPDIAFDGSDAINKLTAHPYDLIILDWTMPDCNGGKAVLSAQQIIHKLTSQTGYNHWKDKKVKVIIFTGKEVQEIPLPDCENFEVVDLWKKPLKLSQLTLRLMKQLESMGAV